MTLILIVLAVGLIGYWLGDELGELMFYFLHRK